MFSFALFRYEERENRFNYKHKGRYNLDPLVMLGMANGSVTTYD